MDIVKILNKYYSDKQWNCCETYDTLEWNDTTIPKHSKEHLESLWNDLLKDEMRTRRDELLKDSDAYALVDFPHKTPEKRQEWMDYRIKLRQFPEVWILGDPFPTPPE